MSTLTNVMDDTPRPIVLARALRLTAGRTTVFAGLDVDLPVSGYGAVVGPSGAGKSTLLLSLTGRMQGVTGTLLVSGLDAVRHPGPVRQVTSVARVADLIGPEPTLTVAECITERSLLDAGAPRQRHAAFASAAELMGLDVDPDALYGDLPPVDQTRAAVALACVRRADLVVLDDLDLDATLDEQAALWRGIAALAASGTSVIAATTERAAVPAGATIIDLS